MFFLFVLWLHALCKWKKIIRDFLLNYFWPFRFRLFILFTDQLQISQNHFETPRFKLNHHNRIRVSQANWRAHYAKKKVFLKNLKTMENYKKLHENTIFRFLFFLSSSLDYCILIIIHSCVLLFYFWKSYSKLFETAS